MKTWMRIFGVMGLLLVLSGSAQALDINLLNIDVNGPEGQQAAQLYGNSYGFPPEQVRPALLGPAEEVPTILKIAQAAGTVPMSVWMMRKMGMDYGRILQTFALGPATLMGASAVPFQGPGYYAPTWSRFMNPYYVQSSRMYFLKDVMRIDPLGLTQIPWGGRDFTRALLGSYPVGKGYWLPPGQAKKLGLWVPPGQAKKMWAGGKGWDDDDDFHGNHEVKIKNVKHKYKFEEGHGHHSFKEHGKGHGKGK